MLMEGKYYLVAWKFKLGFQTLFWEDISLYLLNILSNRSPKMTKNFKNYILILAIVNYRNWLYASPRLTVPEKNNSVVQLSALLAIASTIVAMYF